MDSHLSITGLHRESARTPVGSAEEEGLRRKLVSTNPLRMGLI